MRFTSCVRAIFVLATWIAIGLFLRGEHQSFLDEQVEVLLVDGGTGNKLKHFRYRTWIVTQPSGPDPEWSEWIEHKSDAPLSLTVPQHCRLNFQAQLVSHPILDAKRRYESLLVAPETNHQWTIRIEPDWDKALPKANRLDGPHVLSGRVTDEQGNPVTKFGIRVFFQNSYMESYLLEIEDPEGRFNLHCPLPIAGYFVEAEHFALEQCGFTERTLKAMPDTLNLTIPLKRGFRISGRAKLTKAHGRNTTLVLIDVRTEPFRFYYNQVIPYKYEPYWNKYALERPKSFPSYYYVYVNRKQLSPTGDFQFENLQKGKYLLQMMYDDQLVTEQPIVVDSADVTIEPIVIPPIGSVYGVVKEWNSWPSSPLKKG